MPSISKCFWFWKQILTADTMLTGHLIGKALLRYFCSIMAGEWGYLEQRRTLREQLYIGARGHIPKTQITTGPKANWAATIPAFTVSTFPGTRNFRMGG